MIIQIVCQVGVRHYPG